MWRILSQKLKHITTGDHIDIKQKYKTPYTVPNHVCDRDLQLIRQRRQALGSCSKYAGNRAPYDALLGATRQSQVGISLWNLNNLRNTNFNELDIPLPQAKLNENLHSFYQFLKEHYLHEALRSTLTLQESLQRL